MPGTSFEGAANEPLALGLIVPAGGALGEARGNGGPPIFDELHAPAVHASSDARQPDEIDIRLELGRSGFGPFQVVYMIAMGLIWSAMSGPIYADKFLVAPGPDKDPFAVFATGVDNSPVYVDYYDELQLENAFNLTADGDSTGREKAGARMRVAQYIGWGIGGFCSGLCDKVGVKWVTYLFISVYVAATWAMTFCPFTGAAAMTYIAACKAVSFIGIGCFQMSSFTWQDEMIDDGHKALLSGIPNLFCCFGSLLAGSLNQFVSDWKVYLRVLSGVCFLFFLYIPGTVETPYTFYRRGNMKSYLRRVCGSRKSALERSKAERVSDTLRVLAEIRQVNGDRGADAARVLQNPKEVAGLGESGTSTQTASGCGTLVNMAILMLVWLSWSMAFFGVANEGAAAKPLYEDNFWVQIWSLPGSAIGYYLTNNILDRRLLLSACFLTCGLSMLAASAANHCDTRGDGLGVASGPLLYFASMMACVGCNVAFVVSPSVFNGKYKMRLVSVLFVTARVGCILSALITDMGLAWVGSAVYGSYDKSVHDKVLKPVLFGAPAVAAGCLVWLLPSGTATSMRDDVSRVGRGLLHLCRGSDAGGLFRWARGDWKYFFAPRRLPLVVGIAAALAFYCAGSAWAVYDVFFAGHNNTLNSTRSG